MANIALQCMTLGYAMAAYLEPLPDANLDAIKFGQSVSIEIKTARAN